MPRVVLALLLVASLRACVAYEYEHEFWLNVDGSGSVYFTARPDLWAAFKGLPLPPDEDAAQAAVRRLFESSGLTVRRTRVSHRRGRTYVFVYATFTDVNRLSGTPSFPDLRIALKPEGDRIRLDGAWTPPAAARAVTDREGLTAVRFHLPSKIYAHENAHGGVGRGNIVTWEEDLARATEGAPLVFGATLDRRSILYTTVGLFAASITLGLALLAVALYAIMREGRRMRESAP
jgi:hypothetical protein